MAAALPSFRQRLKQLFSRLALALVLCLSLALTACSSANTGLSGNYVEDTVAVADSLLSTIALGADDPARAEAEIEARSLSNGYVARYRPRSSVNGLGSFTTMQTAINSMAGHYTNYPNRPLPEALKERIAKELKKAETNATRGA
ncbi:Photosystem II lipoprotein Psb27 [Cyanobium usitatum str. Tous]|jgi:photosystem II Psb27 protein|uniref:photosystem II protein Psb27 n=1 Tax=Cyanobium usitatum TaxID=2304190 RepID=UPI002AD29AC6|nr:photosystem II protein Psb27 [Cyanobium usitatum]CAK6693125.1 Photosystem II lipoprotein Psb27 [Cyanobium usitatum str. Tous]